MDSMKKPTELGLVCLYARAVSGGGSIELLVLGVKSRLRVDCNIILKCQNRSVKVSTP